MIAMRTGIRFDQRDGKRNKMADFKITDPEIIKMLKGLTEEGRQGVADQIQESLDSGEVKKIIKEETKGNHSTTSEDSLELRIKELEEELLTIGLIMGATIRDTIDDVRPEESEE